MAEYRAALGLDPSSADAHLHMGIALGEQGLLDEAIAHLETAARLAPEDPVVHVNLAQAYRLSGQATRAEEEMRRAGRR
jgi:Flp pilus assembly protein TadD